MAVSPEVEAYMDAMKRCHSAFANFDRIASRVIDVAYALENNPDQFGFANLAERLPDNPNLRNISDAAHFPSALDLQRALSDCQVTVQQVKATWGQVSQKEQATLKPPGNPWKDQLSHTRQRGATFVSHCYVPA